MHTRPFRTDYAGSWFGHCKSRESAIQAAIKHILYDGYSRCTIIDLRTNKDVARVRMSKDKKRAEVIVTEEFKRYAR